MVVHLDRYWYGKEVVVIQAITIPWHFSSPVEMMRQLERLISHIEAPLEEHPAMESFLPVCFLALDCLSSLAPDTITPV